MTTIQLDNVDRRLLREVQRDNRKTLRTLADDIAPSGAEIRQFERRMQRCAEVVQCSELAGDVDYLLTVRVSDLPAFADFTRKHLADDRSVKSYRSLPVMRQTKNELTVPT